MFNNDTPDEVKSAISDLNQFRDHLIGLANSSISHDKLDDEERKMMERSRDKIIHSIDQLTRYISEIEYSSAQAHALYELWSALGHSFIIGSHAVRNPTSERLKEDELKDFYRKSGAMGASQKKVKAMLWQDAVRTTLHAVMRETDDNGQPRYSAQGSAVELQKRWGNSSPMLPQTPEAIVPFVREEALKIGVETKRDGRSK